MSLLIYTPETSPRLDYTLNFVFREVIGCTYELTHNMDEYERHTGAKLNYSNKKNLGGIQVASHPLLFEQEIKKQEIDVFRWQRQSVFFKTASRDIPFDVFAATFYLVSRYEEYITEEKDEFERFPHKASLAFQNNFLDLPLVDIWLQELKHILLEKYPEFSFKEKQFQFIPTYDIDIAFSYKHKGLLRNAGGALRDISKGDLKAVKNRMLVLSDKQKDPFDSFDFLDGLHMEYKLSPIYFFLLGSGGPLDKNLSVEQPNFRDLIKDIATKYQTGIHPSYRSNDEPEELQLEIERLNTITDTSIHKSRQHYIRFQLPNTYHDLLEKGITEDYSMGYGSINGFRASTATPFLWFDLKKNEVTELKVFPFCFMECNSFFEQKQNIAETQKELEQYIGTVQDVSGTFISIWHNFSLGTDPLWTGWQELYEHQIRTLANT